MPIPSPSGEGGKEERGRVLVVAGSRELIGAAILAGTAVLRVGAGKLQYNVPASIAFHLGAAMPEARSVAMPETPSGAIAAGAAETIAGNAGKCSAVLIGPGLLDEEATGELVAALLRRLEALPLVLDAAAMMGLKRHRELLARHAGRIVVTPHAGEMAGMLGRDKAEIEADPAAVAREVAQEYGTVVVLKGACSYIAGPGGEAWSCGHGNVGLGTSGSGDTLAGFITGLMARGADPVRAALWGVYLHGEAGNRLARSRGLLGYLAREIPDEVPAILAEMC
ncbi:NAD(P)H-hydrate dehydratase [Enterovirga sp. DB1703]|uniref:ADP-dependent (S)-NAD(P)H-hydrate dehydratase n=2 Tax=Enterovirga aerilata TaxID=2730920 RepID=A0A849I544_9HYPH|nr:NAD(P)H-hydrate dehydratase [Enterovirga sp. DB1703]NNM71230.1 NAD(P)H-hydrate dehydratase [Enterovirga sp. DB1703]